MKQKKIEKWMVYCEPCSHKQIITNEDPTSADLTEIKNSDVPGGSPFLDKKTSKTITKPSSPQSKKFKCPNCGRGVIAKKLPSVYENAYKIIEKEKEKKKKEEDKKKRIEDGKPLIRDKESEEFSG